MAEQLPIASGHAVGHEKLWNRVDMLVDRAPDLAAIREHRLGPLAARRWRGLGRLVPRALVDEERVAAAKTMAVPALLSRIREVARGPVVVFKGPEVAMRYPDPALRPYGDVDLLVRDPVTLHRDLRRAGFEEVGDPRLFVDIHHLRPLQLAPLPLLVEIHSAPKWLEAQVSAPVDALLAEAVRSALQPDGILTLRPEHHVLVLAVHAWTHEPLGRALDLIDVAAVMPYVDYEETCALASAWGIERLWRTTLGATSALLGEAAEPLPLRLWARNVCAVRRRTVLEGHLERWLAGFWALPPRAALRQTGAAAIRTVGRRPGESWRDKLLRSALAITDASTARSEHDRRLAARRR